MPYLIILDDEHRKLDLLPQDLSDVVFKMSPPENSDWQATLINVTAIKMIYTRSDGRAVYIGLIHDVDDAVPFAVVPLDHSRSLRPGEGLMILPGQLRISIRDIRSSKKIPNPEPVGLWDRIRSKMSL